MRCATFGCTFSATRSELHVCRVFRNGMIRSPARRARSANMRVMLPGSIGVPYFVVKISPCLSCQTSPAAFRSPVC